MFPLNFLSVNLCSRATISLHCVASCTATGNVIQYAEAIGSIDAEAFMEKIDMPVFSNDDNKKMLAAIKECISLVKGCEPENEELWKFCKVFILLLFDMDCAESVNRTLSASLIKCNSPENPIFVWSRLVEYAGQCNQAAASVSKESIDRNIRELFPKNNTIQLPPDPITAIDLFIPTIALIGAWKEDNEFDRKMIEQISGMEYSEFEAKARTMLSQNSEYLQLTNGNWKVCHKEELLNQCKNKLFDDSIGKLLEAVDSILRQKSKCVASKMPYFIPVSGEYDNSLELRGNLVKSLCWVKKNLSELSQCNQEKIENNIYTLVSTLLQDAKWTTWTSLRDCLQNLAELSPEAFLKEAERGIINNPTEIVNLFPPKSGELSGINYISNLLWALEILAWSPEYLVHSISVLGLLEALPYERTNWTNTPINSIVSILLPWYPQTMADLEKRKNALKCLKTDNPRVFWSTLKKLLPNKTRSTSGNPRPKYLKLEIPEEVKVTNAEAHECYVYLVELAVDTARNKNEKLIELIDQLGYMYEPTLTDYLDCLENGFEFDTDENTFEVWIKLRECMARIEPTEGKVIYKQIDRIRQLTEKMEPTDIRVKHREWYLGNRYLFDKGNYANRWKMLEDKKLSAVKEIFDEYGSEEVERFGSAVKNVHDVANKLGHFLKPKEMSSIIEKCFIGILSKEFTINCLISFVYTQGAEKLLESGKRNSIVNIRYYAYEPIDPQKEYLPKDVSRRVDNSVFWNELFNQLRRQLLGKLSKYRVPVINNLLPQEQLRSEFFRIAAEYAQDENSLFIVAIDGIDHAARANVSENTFLSALPNPEYLPENVKIVIAGQPKEDYRNYPEWLFNNEMGYVKEIHVPSILKSDIYSLVENKFPEMDNVFKNQLTNVVCRYADGNTLSAIFIAHFCLYPVI